MHETAERTIERIRRRQAAPDEALGLAEGALRMEIGVRAAEKIVAAGEDRILAEVASAIEREPADAESKRTALAAARHALRHALFGTATDDWTGIRSASEEIARVPSGDAEIELCVRAIDAVCEATAARLDPAESLLATEALDWIGRTSACGAALSNRREAAVRAAVRGFFAERAGDDSDTESIRAEWTETFLDMAEAVFDDAFRRLREEGSGDPPPPLDIASATPLDSPDLDARRRFAALLLDEAERAATETRAARALPELRRAADEALVSMEWRATRDARRAAVDSALRSPVCARIPEADRDDLANALVALFERAPEFARADGTPRDLEALQKTQLVLQRIDVRTDEIAPAVEAIRAFAERALSETTRAAIGDALAGTLLFLSLAAACNEHKVPLLELARNDLPSPVPSPAGHPDFGRNWVAMETELILLNLTFAVVPGLDRNVSGMLSTLASSLLATAGGRENARAVFAKLRDATRRWFPADAGAAIGERLAAMADRSERAADEREIAEAVSLQVADALARRKAPPVLRRPDAGEDAAAILHAIADDLACPGGSSTRRLLESTGDGIALARTPADAVERFFKASIRALESRKGRPRDSAVEERFARTRDALRCVAALAAASPPLGAEAAAAFFKRRTTPTEPAIRERLARFADRGFRAAATSLSADRDSALRRWLDEAAALADLSAGDSAEFVAAMRRTAGARLDRVSAAAIDGRLAVAESAARVRAARDARNAGARATA